MKRVLSMLAIIGCFCGPGVAETPADQPMGWDQQVATLVTALVQEDPAPAALMLEGMNLQAFDPDASSRVMTLLERTSGNSIIFWRVYTGVPTNLAGDMAEDINAADVPEPLRRQFTPPGPAAMRDANTVAAEWVSDALSPKEDQPIAVVVTWRGNSALPSLSVANYMREITFLLIAGERDSATHQPAIRLIRFGNPLAASQ